MLESLIRHRPKNLLAVYVEPQNVEVLRAHRQWRTWEIESTENFPVPEGENVFDFLQRLSIRPRGRKGTALLLVLPRVYYTFHREHYPASLQDQLEEALTYDWQDNLFYEPDKTLFFAGQPAPVDGHLSVPIFALPRNVYEKFQQVLGAAAFDTFAVIPSALAFESYLPDILSGEESFPIEILGRIVDPSQLEINRFYKGHLLDSIILGRSFDNLKLFRENLRCCEGGQCQETVHIHLLCTDGESNDDYLREWSDENLPLYIHAVPESILSRCVEHFFEQDEVRTFEAPLHLKPWEVPRVAWPVLAIVAFFALFSVYQIYSLSQMKETTRNLKKQTAQLEMQLKPIEQLQSKISKFQEDQKTLTQFNSQGYPLLEILSLLTQATPSDTWLNYLALRNGQLMLRGESKSAIKYLSELSKVEGLTDVRFASPVTRNPTSDEERFNVQVQVDMEKLKKVIETMPSEEPPEDQSAMEPTPMQPSSIEPVKEVGSGGSTGDQTHSTKIPGRGLRRGK